MARKLQPKNKDIVNLEVVNANKVWEKTNKGKYKLKSDYDYFGKIERGTTAFISMTNSHGENAKFIEDTNKLPKKIKNELVNKFYKDKKVNVVYLVKKK